MDKKLIDNINQITQNYDIPSKLSKNTAWEQINKKIEQKPKSVNKTTVRINLIIGSMAAAAVFLVIFYLGMFNTGKYSPEFIAGFSKTEFLYLPDSSSVMLNSNSKMKYHYNKFTGERNVVVKGEAYFNVQKGRKFIVDFEGGSIKVTGTEFNIVAYSDEYINVDCTEGHVQFVFDRKNIKLAKGQGVKVFKGRLIGPYFVDPLLIKERKNGLYFWDKVSVDELIHLIGYRFGYKTIIDSETAQRNFSGKIDLTDLYNGLNIVSYAMDLKYFIDEEAQTITINAK